MADDFDLEQEVARLRGKQKALTVITVLFMLASGGLAAAVYAKVSKKPPEPEKLERLVIEGVPEVDVSVSPGMVRVEQVEGTGGMTNVGELTPGSLQVVHRALHSSLEAEGLHAGLSARGGLHISKHE